MIMFPHFDENELLAFWFRRTLPDHLISMVNRHEHDLVFGEHDLKQLDFSYSTGSFRDTRFSMEFLGQFFLQLMSIFASLPYALVFGMVVALGFDGDQGACTAEVVLVVDVNDASLCFQHLLNVQRFQSEPFASTATSRVSDVGHF